MLQTDVHNYLKTFFKENDSPVIEQSDGHLHIQLSIDMDKNLMNRPFYWHYLEKIGGVPNPMKLTLITDETKAPEDLKGERIHFGAPRLHQVFRLAKELGSHVKMYEKVARTSLTGGSLSLLPWLNVNVKISYEAEKKKDRLVSLGLNLVNGEMVDGFCDQMLDCPLEPVIPDYCFTVSPLIKPASGMNRIRQYLEDELKTEDHAWAHDAVNKMEADLRLLDTFYEQSETVPETYENEKEAIRNQYEPKINMSIINGGLFYLHQHPLNIRRVILPYRR
ncbi:YqhG family protein [Bacillus sp. H-16]|uniref:YqhG family protein n=1 Tax=Alteribacter salitolerans TaxID=2912333 RepID=UPI0019633DF7|nr:YqhG family protein [Alteribacter salitolerans]MBM7097312.1 YqhG family protein [Alteribacter salitolerans]